MAKSENRGDWVRINYDEATIHRILCKAALAEYPQHAKLIAKVPLACVERHKRTMTVRVTPEIAAEATPYHSMNCAWGVATRHQTQTLSTAFIRRKAYCLQWAEGSSEAFQIFAYGVPDMARKLEIKFDRTGKVVKPLVVTFRPLPPCNYKKHVATPTPSRKGIGPTAGQTHRAIHRARLSLPADVVA